MIARTYAIYALGFFAQGLFGARLVVQLILSERKGRVVSPTVFWYLSLAASFLFLIYGGLRSDAIIAVGQTISYYIYIRNLQLKNAWRSLALLLRMFIFVLPFVPWFVIIHFNVLAMSSSRDAPWTDIIFITGAIGQLALNLRFVYQWIYSETENQSVLPLGFWVISTLASVLVIVYAYAKSDPVLLVAQGLGIFVYARNMIIYFRTSQKGEAND